MKTKRPLRFEYWKSNRNKQWYWRIRAGNGEPVCQSEGYKSRAGVMKAYQSLFNFEAGPDIVDLNKEAHEKFKAGCAKKPKHYEGKLNRSFP